MADILSKAERSRLMGKIRSSNNASTELKAVKEFRRVGLRGWRRRHPLMGSPDFVFPKERVAVFVDGCFWHGHPRLGRIPQTNRAFWEAKIARNKARDLQVNRELRRRGWAVVRIWEHEVGKPPMWRKLRAKLPVGDTSPAQSKGSRPE